jgi:hypothetical protein
VHGFREEPSAGARIIRIIIFQKGLTPKIRKLGLMKVILEFDWDTLHL